MKYSEYRKQMQALSELLDRTISTDPQDPQSFCIVVKEINELNHRFYVSRRRRPWPALMSCIILMVILLYIVFEILSLLWIRGSQ